MLINQQLLIHMHANSSSLPPDHHAPAPGTLLLASRNPLRLSGCCPLGPACGPENMPRHSSSLQGLQGSVLVRTPAPWRGTVITLEGVLYLIKQLLPRPWGAVHRDTGFCS